jgi:hypothetical protein
MNMKFNYYLTGWGWANLDIEIDNHQFNYRDSLVMGDSLGDLLKKILMVLDSEKICPIYTLFGEQEDTLHWVIDEEGTSVEFDFQFNEARDKARLQIMQHYEEDECVFEGEIDVGEFLFEIVKSCDEIINTYGITGYFINSLSNCEFPITYYLLLKNYLQTGNLKYEASDEIFSCDIDEEIDLIKLWRN